MKILVTGASGFVGSHLCERLIKEGHTVFALVRTPAKFNFFKDEKLILIKGDLDSESLPWITLLPPDLNSCIHTAGIVHSYNPDEFFRVNTLGTENLVNALKSKYPDHFQFTLISSLAGSGPSVGSDKRSESDMDLPISVYGKSKKEAEVALARLAPKSWSLSVIRPPMVIGPRDTAVLDIFKMVKGKFIVLPGSNSRSKQYSFVCVFDLIETITQVNVQNKTGIYFSAFPNTVSFDQIILQIKKELNGSWLFYLPLPLILVRFVAALLDIIYKLRPHGLRLTPDKYHELAALNWTCNASKSERELGQTYHYDLERTIKVTLLDYKARHWI